MQFAIVDSSESLPWPATFDGLLSCLQAEYDPLLQVEDILWVFLWGSR